MVALHKILKKCEYMHRGNTWGGYLQPVEVITLIEAGYKCTDSTERKLEDAKRYRANGFCNPSWFYFIRNRKHDEWV